MTCGSSGLHGGCHGERDFRASASRPRREARPSSEQCATARGVQARRALHPTSQQLLQLPRLSRCRAWKTWLAWLWISLWVTGGSRSGASALSGRLGVALKATLLKNVNQINCLRRLLQADAKLARQGVRWRAAGDKRRSESAAWRVWPAQCRRFGWPERPGPCRRWHDHWPDLSLLLGGGSTVGGSISPAVLRHRLKLGQCSGHRHTFRRRTWVSSSRLSAKSLIFPGLQSYPPLLWITLWRSCPGRA